MAIAIIYLLISFILENFMANIFPSTLTNISLFTTVYTVIALVVIYPQFNNYRKYYILVFIFGFFFDAVYTSTFFLNTFIFIVIALLVGILYNLFPYNYIFRIL